MTLLLVVTVPCSERSRLLAPALRGRALQILVAAAVATLGLALGMATAVPADGVAAPSAGSFTIDATVAVCSLVVIDVIFLGIAVYVWRARRAEPWSGIAAVRAALHWLSSRRPTCRARQQSPARHRGSPSRRRPSRRRA